MTGFLRHWWVKGRMQVSDTPQDGKHGQCPTARLIGWWLAAILGPLLGTLCTPLQLRSSHLDPGVTTCLHLGSFDVSRLLLPTWAQKSNSDPGEVHLPTFCSLPGVRLP